MSDDTQEAGITSPIGSVSFKGKKTAEFIAVICLCLLFLLAYVLYEHKLDAKAENMNLTSVIKELAVAQREGNQILREQVCLLSLSQEKREREFASENGLCKRLARER